MTKQKQNLYERLLERQASAASEGYHYEACWFAYAILENRSRSILANSADRAGFGGDISSKLARIRGLLEDTETKVVSGKPVRDKRTGKKVKKPKYSAVHTVKRTLILVAQRWVKRRNELVHDLASGKLTLDEADKDIERLSKIGLRLAPEFCSAARRIRKRAKKDAKQIRVRNDFENN